MTEPTGFRRFNLETLSGIYPGVRTEILQRVQIGPIDPPTAEAQEVGTVLWLHDPATWVLVRELGDKEAEEWMRWPASVAADLPARLAQGLAQEGQRPLACATCGHWEPTDQTTQDGLALGGCGWRSADPDYGMGMDAPKERWLQSALSPLCLYFAGKGIGQPKASVVKSRTDLTLPVPTGTRPGFWGQVRRRLLGEDRNAAPTPPWAEIGVERSGVGAGTEPCFACQGRLANLGALTVATEDDDKRTYSIWRCRICRTYYLNDWIDRWERLDNLETEERFYRMAPAEALAVLAMIHRLPGSEHPAGRHQRAAQGAWFAALIGQRPPLTHQIRHGR